MTVEYQKVWRTMNDLEQVISKVCSAREMIDVANDAIVDRDYSRAETMTMAAHEFLGYFIEEFDEKFKDAWQATVGDLRDGDKDDPSPECKGAWDSFWEENYYPEEYNQYTEEELNAMCGKAELDAQLEEIRKAGGYEWTPEQETPKKKWVLPVEQVHDDYYVSFPDDLLKVAKLKEGDEVNWIDNGDGSFSIRKVHKV